MIPFFKAHLLTPTGTVLNLVSDKSVAVPDVPAEHFSKGYSSCPRDYNPNGPPDAICRVRATAIPRRSGRTILAKSVLLYSRGNAIAILGSILVALAG